MPVGDESEIPGDTYAKRPINIHKAPKGTHTATETTGQSRAQESTKTGEGSCRQRGRDGRIARTCCSTGSAFQSWRRGRWHCGGVQPVTTSASNTCLQVCEGL